MGNELAQAISQVLGPGGGLKRYLLQQDGKVVAKAIESARAQQVSVQWTIDQPVDGLLTVATAWASIDDVLAANPALTAELVDRRGRPVKEDR